MQNRGYDLKKTMLFNYIFILHFKSRVELLTLEILEHDINDLILDCCCLIGLGMLNVIFVQFAEYK